MQAFSCILTTKLFKIVDNYWSFFHVILGSTKPFQSVVFVSYLPILYNGVLGPGIKASILSGLAGFSHYRQVSAGLHTVPYVYIIIELDFQWVVLLGVRSVK